VRNWKTPTLVVHGGRDYRVVDTQGIATFTALQRRGVPSRFLYFPEENHWVLKPAHSKRWHEEVLSWIDKYTRG
jgi:dipeptidyl aminopeptidase/acylaminoacyl peptidase